MRASASGRAAGTRAWIALAMAGAIPVATLGIFAYRTGTDTVESLIEANNTTSAVMSRAFVEQRFANWTHTLSVFAGLPEVRSAVTARDETAARKQLRALVEGQPHVVRAFVTDRSALLWSDFPKASESLGERFGHRDWYEGVSKEWAPYVSQVYRRHAAPQPLLVAIAAPVRASGGNEIAGVVVYQVVLEELTRVLEKIEVGDDGYVFLLDHHDQVAAHPHVSFASRTDEPPVVPGIEKEDLLVDRSDPITGEAMLATHLPVRVGPHTWTIVAQQPSATALAPLNALALRIGGACLIALLLIGALVFRLSQLHFRTRDWNERLEKEVTARTTELRRKEEQLRQSQKMEAVGQLAGGVAHDFNNLLSVILGVSDILLQQWRRDGVPGGDETLRDDVQEIRDAGERATVLTRALLAVSRKEVRQPEILDLNDVVQETAKILRRLVGEHIELNLHLADELDLVSVDPGQLEQVLLNLVVNARDAMPKGGSITVETRNVDLDESYVADHADAHVGPHVMLAVSDTGEGMDAATRERIFEPFFTTKGEERGTGLGLATVYGIVKQSGGNIWVYSEPGRGTVFKVYLPQAKAKAGAIRETDVERELPSGTETVLLVEDDPAVRRLIEASLEMGGYTVLTAADADEALAVVDLHQDEIQLLVTDVILPKLGGPDLAAVLAERIAGLKVLFVSGYTGGTLQNHLVDASRVTFLEKPIRPGRLRIKVREALEHDGTTA
ncbi:MAG: ATP-binding protein [Myxococcota bacterium]